MNEMNYPVHLPGTDDTVHMWANEHEIENTALEQVRHMAKLPWIHGIRIMPDVHWGNGAAVGSVIAMKQALSPSAVGVDLGCGVASVKTSIKESQLESLDVLRFAIEAAIPVGFNMHDKEVDLKKLGLGKGLDNFWKRFRELHVEPSDRLEARAVKQLSTLGGGNHFIEVCADETGTVWLTLHSGSRYAGKEIAERHIKVAKALEHNKQFGDLAVFLSGTPEMDAYRFDLEWSQEYAARSRAGMMALFEREFSKHFAARGLNVEYGDRINVHHNYVAEEIIDGVPMLVTRKGAIRAGAGELALIPGSMGTGSYIVRGLGNPASFQSASHGAGRKMSRGAAKRTFTVEDLVEQTAGIECRKDEGVVDEIPGAYKDLHSVISAQEDLVTPVAHLRTLMCIKG